MSRRYSESRPGADDKPDDDIPAVAYVRMSTDHQKYSTENQLGVGAIPTVTIKRELKMGILNQVQVSKHFPPMPIIGSYQATTEISLVKQVVEQARLSAARFCATVDPTMAWVN